MEGLYEIHITVAMESLHAFTVFCSENKYKSYVFVNDGYMHQAMMSKHIYGTKERAIERAKSIAREMHGVIRIKVEAIGLSLPQQGYDGYYEFHIKYPQYSYESLNRILCTIPNTMLSYNIKKSVIEPVVTLRVEKTTLTDALRLKDDLIRQLKHAGYHSNERMHIEFCVYDTNPSLDVSKL